MCIVGHKMEAADQISALVEDQLVRFKDGKSVARFRQLSVAPRAEDRDWDYDQAGQKYTCWMVFEHRESNVGIAYCSHGFGPRCPWGLLFLHGEQRVLSMGMDSGSFSDLEDAFRDTWAYEALVKE